MRAGAWAAALLVLGCARPESRREQPQLRKESGDTPASIGQASSPPAAKSPKPRAPTTAKPPQANAGHPRAKAAPPPANATRDVLPDSSYRWLASHCHLDRLGHSPYTKTWRDYAAAERNMPADALPVAAPEQWPPLHEPKRAAELARTLAETWSARAQSHVIDCNFMLPFRFCDRCTSGGKNRNPHYVAYLPKALFEEPASVRSILLLVPGGRGGRHRPFLSPIPGKTFNHRSSGGLRTKQLTDAWLRDHPGASEPIVVAVEAHGQDYQNGLIEFLSTDLPQHLSDTFLGGRPIEQLILGAEGVSSGAMAILRTLHKKPEQLATVGLTCMSCNMVDPRRRGARLLFEHDRWAAQLAQRRRDGRFAMRFSIGSRDGQLPCNRRFYDAMAKGGLFTEQPPAYTRCSRDGAPDAEHCDMTQDGWVQWADEMHHYGMLEKSYPSQLYWHLAELDRIARKRAVD